MFDNKLKLNDDKTESELCNPRSYDVSTDKINEKMTIFVNFFEKKCQDFGNFLTFKWQYSGGSGKNITS